MKFKVFARVCLLLSIQLPICGAYTISGKHNIALNGAGVEITISMSDAIMREEVLTLYHANGWSSANKPESLLAALNNSDALVTARHAGALVGLGNAISDRHLVVYYPHLLVDPGYQRQGIGRKLMEALAGRYGGFHQQVLVADAGSIDFYQAIGFQKADRTQAMWVYSGNEH